MPPLSIETFASIDDDERLLRFLPLWLWPLIGRVLSPIIRPPRPNYSSVPLKMSWCGWGKGSEPAREWTSAGQECEYWAWALARASLFFLSRTNLKLSCIMAKICNNIFSCFDRKSPSLLWRFHENSSKFETRVTPLTEHECENGKGISWSTFIANIEHWRMQLKMT